MILLMIISGFLIVGFGAYSGSHGTSLAWRRYGIPSLIVLNAALLMRSWWVVTMFSMIGALSIGYGVPDENDDGSALGQLWYKITGESHFWTDVFMRGTVGFLVGLSLLSAPILDGQWITTISWWIVLVLNYIFWGAIYKNEGNFIIRLENRNIEILLEDIYIYTGLALCLLMIIA